MSTDKRSADYQPTRARDDRDTDPRTAPAPDDPIKPSSPTEIKKTNWKYVLQSTLREFGNDECADISAGLTYRTLFSIFPALIAVVSILGLFGQSGDTVKQVLAEAENMVPGESWDTVSTAIEGLLTAPAPGLGLIIGLATALWSASAYVKHFSRAMNRIYEMPEGRHPIVFNLAMYGLTALILVLVTVAMLMIVVSGPVAEIFGKFLGISATALAVWGVAKWFVVGLIMVIVVALLYWGTPNVKQPKFRWISLGALLTIIVSVLATYGFFTYVSHFGSYDATYGTLAGVIIALLWMYIINTILLLGAELDAELERGRQLQAGIEAEVELQLPPRSTVVSEKKADKEKDAIEAGRALRYTRGESTDPMVLPPSMREPRRPGRVLEKN